MDEEFDDILIQSLDEILVPQAICLGYLPINVSSILSERLPHMLAWLLDLSRISQNCSVFGL